MSTYTVTAERSGKWWVLQAQEAPGAISQVARLDQADDIREAIAFVTGEPEESIEIELKPVLPEAIESARAQVERLRKAAARLTAEAALESRALARHLASTGLTVRDVGAVLGMSHQRAQQLIKAAPVLPPADLGTGMLAYIVPAPEGDDATFYIGGDASEPRRTVYIEPVKELTAEAVESFAEHVQLA